MGAKKQRLIISASRRTDIPAFYAKWFMNRIREGYCVTLNPFNPSQPRRVYLKPEDVLVIVFWTRHPRPLFPYLEELDNRGYKYYFQYTLMNNPKSLDPGMPDLDYRIKTFQYLANKIGPDRVVWRYDPIVISQETPPEFHLEWHEKIGERLHGYTKRNVISIVDTHYRKIQSRIRISASNGLHFQKWQDKFGDFVRQLATNAQKFGMEIQSCAEDIDLSPYGVPPGKCVDDDLIKRVFGIDVSHCKDKGQRGKCGCVKSRDIGMYDTCLFGCVYCYATTSFEKARENHKKHNPDLPLLVNGIDVLEKDVPEEQQEQKSLFPGEENNEAR
ncbi:MAG: hypothetical protein KatS3mg019_1056 [Fimbriimonadales bacterium]|nr:MAG: hypothetical protein KatS3mg019_1056 [Fimbriimonadales bacterium]